jgi:hypothetical protein
MHFHTTTNRLSRDIHDKGYTEKIDAKAKVGRPMKHFQGSAQPGKKLCEGKLRTNKWTNAQQMYDMKTLN